MTYFWQSGILWKQNGIPLYVGNTRLSKQWIVWWMPSNWLIVPLVLVFAILAIVWRDFLSGINQ